MKTDLNYRVTGQGTPIIFIHGFTLDHRMWSPQVEYFSKTHQVITYDMRGFGKSPIPTNTYSHHQDLANLFNHLKINKAHIVGLSLGGEIALDFATSHPGKCQTITTIDGSINGYKSTIDWDVHAQDQSLEKVKQNWLNHQVFKETRKNKYAMSVIKPQIAAYSGWHWLQKDIYKQKLTSSTLKSLSKITCPTQIILGEKDLNYFHTIANLIQQKLPNAKIHIIPNSGHIPNLETPKQCNQIIKKFIEKTL